MSKQVRVALVLAAVGIVASVAAEWAVRHLTEAEASPPVTSRTDWGEQP
jgi:hypothetical protein